MYDYPHENNTPRVSVNSQIKKVTVDYGITALGECAFASPVNLQSVTVPEGITSIGLYCFAKCSGLASVNFPNSLVSIGPGAFAVNRSLTSLVLPPHLNTVDDNAFHSCTGLTSVTCLNPVPVNIIPNTFENVRLDSLILYVPSGSAKACKAAPVWKDFGSTVRYAGGICGDSAYWHAKDTVLTVYGKGEMFSYAYSGFNCTDTVIDGLAVEICHHIHVPWDSIKQNITGIRIEDGIETVGHNTFTSFIHLKSLAISDDVHTMGYNAFAGAWNLESVKLPRNLRSMAIAVFDQCVKLDSVIIPEGVTFIDSWCFEQNYSLSCLTILNPAPPALNGLVFLGTGIKNASLYVPSGSVAAYKAANEWKDFGKIGAKLTGIGINKSSLVLSDYGPKETLSAIPYPDDALTDSIIWTSSNPDIVSVDSTGLITTLSKGTATVTAACNNFTATATVISKGSTDARLISLATDRGNWNLPFNRDIFNYEVTADHSVTGIKLTADRRDKRTEQDCPLQIGENTVTVSSTAEDEETVLAYNIKITREDLWITDLDIEKTYREGVREKQELISFPFDKENFLYELNVDYLTSKINIQPASNSFAAVFDGSGEHSLQPDENVFDVRVYTSLGTAKTYTIKINRQLNPDCRLQSLNTLPYLIQPYYSLNVCNYTLSVEKTVESIHINAVPISPATVSGQTGTQKLNHGNNLFTLTVTAQDGGTSTYTLEAWRDTLNTDAALSYLAVNPGYLHPQFNPGITSYTAEVENDVEEIIIDAVLRTPTAKFVNTCHDLPGTYPVKAGANHFNFFIFAEDSSYHKIYSLTVTGNRFYDKRKDNMTDINSPFCRWLKPAVYGGIGINSPFAERMNIYSVTGRLLYGFDKPAGAFDISPFTFHPSPVLIVKGSSGWVRKIII